MKQRTDQHDVGAKSNKQTVCGSQTQRTALWRSWRGLRSISDFYFLSCLLLARSSCPTVAAQINGAR